MSTKVKVASLGDALRAGFIPKGESLENPKTGASISLDLFQSIQGQVLTAIPTGHPDYPVTVNGTILPAALVFPKVADVEFKGGKFSVYGDGSVQSIAGMVYERDLIEFLESPEATAASK